MCLWLRPGDWQFCWQERSLVRMKALTDAEIDAYLKTRKWEGCSGAYAIELPHDPYLTVEEGTREQRDRPADGVAGEGAGVDRKRG